MKIDVIIQARMGSTRLPGKVMLDLNGETVLSSLIKQLSFSKLLNRKIIATTINPEDGVIEKFAKNNKIDYFRGSSSDVLDRYYNCAKKFSIEHIVRITADNPLIDPNIVDLVVSEYKKENYDYVNNFTNRTYPYGTEVEVFSFEVLEKTWKIASTLYDREHVTPFMYNHPDMFMIACMEYPVNRSNLRWTVDKKEDYEFVKKLYSQIPKRPILMNDILSIIDREQN